MTEQMVRRYVFYRFRLKREGGLQITQGPPIDTFVFYLPVGRSWTFYRRWIKRESGLSQSITTPKGAWMCSNWAPHAEMCWQYGGEGAYANHTIVPVSSLPEAERARMSIVWGVQDAPPRAADVPSCPASAPEAISGPPAAPAAGTTPRRPRTGEPFSRSTSPGLATRGYAGEQK